MQRPLCNVVFNGQYGRGGMPNLLPLPCGAVHDRKLMTRMYMQAAASSGSIDAVFSSGPTLGAAPNFYPGLHASLEQAAGLRELHVNAHLDGSLSCGPGGTALVTPWHDDISRVFHLMARSVGIPATLEPASVDVDSNIRTDIRLSGVSARYADVYADVITYERTQPSTQDKEAAQPGWSADKAEVIKFNKHFASVAASNRKRRHALAGAVAAAREGLHGKGHGALPNRWSILFRARRLDLRGLRDRNAMCGIWLGALRLRMGHDASSLVEAGASRRRDPNRYGMQRWTGHSQMACRHGRCMATHVVWRP